MEKFTDAHSHINPIKGLGPSVVGKKFKKNDGWLIVLVTLSPRHFDINGFDIDSYQRTFNIMIDSCKIYKELGLNCKLHLGFHPSDVDYYSSLGIKLNKIEAVGSKVINLIRKLIEDGKADGIGEVGRQHYETLPENKEVTEKIMKLALEAAKDLDVPIHLHLEKPSEELINNILDIVKDIGTHRRKVILHHFSAKLIPNVIKSGLNLTIVGKMSELNEAVRYPPYYLVESDYLDDPKRPGAVIVPWTIPRNFKRLIRKGKCNESYIHKINVENILRIY